LGWGAEAFQPRSTTPSAARTLEVGGAYQPAGQCRQERRAKEEDESNADQAAHVLSLQEDTKIQGMEFK